MLHIRQSHAALQVLQPAAGFLGRVVFGLQPGDHAAAGGDLDGLTLLHPLQVGGEVLTQVGHGNMRHHLYILFVHFRSVALAGESGRVSRHSHDPTPISPLAAED